MQIKATRPQQETSPQPKSSVAHPQSFPIQAKAKSAFPDGSPSGLSFGEIPLFPDQSGSGRNSQLPQPLRQRMEATFQSDFSDVRVHQGPEADSLSALAFTQGRDIHFAPGTYSPASAEGQRIIAHELAHVVQQRTGRVSMPQGHSSLVNDEPQLEAEADRMGDAAVAGQRASAPAANHIAPNNSQSVAVGVVQPLRKYRKREEPKFGGQQSAPEPPETLMGMAPEGEQLGGGPEPQAPETLMGMAPEDEQIEGGPPGPPAPETLMGMAPEGEQLGGGPEPPAPETLMGMAPVDEQIEGAPPAPPAPETLMGMAPEGEQLGGGPEPPAPETLMGMAPEGEPIGGGPEPPAPETLMGMAPVDEQIEGAPPAPPAPETLMGMPTEDEEVKP
jgi:hypothetical protein